MEERATKVTGENRQAAVMLYAYLRARHWSDGGLLGPDSGIRFNYRAGRFIKSYLRALPWRDDLYYLQTQGYWVLAAWRMLDAYGEPGSDRIAEECCERILAEQRPDGAWSYPNPEWRGRVTTYEGIWASLGLLETYRRTGEPRFLQGAQRWHAFAEEAIGYQEVAGGRAANYFAGRATSAVPNATTDVLRFLAELAEATGNGDYLHGSDELLGFLAAAQRKSGELPYEFPAALPARLEHFQCFQYNAFECLGLLRYLELTGDRTAVPIIERLLDFLRQGVAADGSVIYECGSPHRRVTYHTAAVAAAFTEAEAAGLAGSPEPPRRLYEHVRSLQQADGGFPHSRGDYRVFSDRRSYPRNLAMILFHLLATER